MTAPSLPVLPGRLGRALGLTLPLLQAGMGGIAGPRLCAAVSRAGAGGVLALYREPPAQVSRLVTATARTTTRPFGVNLIPEVAGPATARAQLDAALDSLPGHAFVTFYGLPDPDLLTASAGAGHPTVVQVGTEATAERALERGATIVVLQGSEAGGHLLGDLPALPLLRAVRKRHADAVLAVAGAVATGADLARAIEEGADGAMAGTVFVATHESEAHPLFRRRIVAAAATDTVVTTRYDIGWPHRPHRVLRNALTDSEQRLPARFVATVTTADGGRLPVPRYSATAPSVRVEGQVEDMAMYCGRSCERVTAVEPVAALLARFRTEYALAVRDARGMTAHA
ncbi:NAD(P)H-dependent flavin oxidoreductase [Protofrankia coriariae]|uniref:NAD(P)H-dependent flavin oxidoreductase n=1 Tax=Protofrankia coriariae TaxID=1562887 RepID=UPI000640439E|nr:nitronate monooxygenase [Protofrankia coriariae]